MDELDLKRRLTEVENEARRLRAEITRMEEQRFVRVHFPGNTRAYCYELPRGVEAEPGDYVIVWSPHTGKNELVRVAYMGRGNWHLRTKLVKGVVHEVTDSSGTSYEFGPLQEVPF